MVFSWGRGRRIALTEGTLESSRRIPAADAVTLLLAWRIQEHASRLRRRRRFIAIPIDRLEWIIDDPHRSFASGMNLRDVSLHCRPDFVINPMDEASLESMSNADADEADATATVQRRTARRLAMATLNSLVKQATSGAVAHDIEALVSPLSGLAARPIPPLKLDKDWKADAGNGAWAGTIAISGDVDIGCATVDPASPAALGIQPAAGHLLLALDLDAKLGLSLGGRLQSAPFALKADAGASGACHLSWLFEHPANATVGAALQADLPALADPLSLPSLFGLKQSAAWRGMCTEIDGTLSASLGLTAGLQATGPVLTVANGQQAPIGVTVGLNGSASLRRQGTFQVTATPDPHGLRVKLQRMRSHDEKFGVQLGATGDFSAVLSDVAGVLASTLPDPKAWSQELLPVLEPGAYLDQLLTEAVDSNVADPTLNVLAKLSLGLTSGSDADATLVQSLGDIIRQHLQGVGDLEVNLVSALGQALPAGFPDRAAVVTALTHKLTDWVGQKASPDALAQKIAAAIDGGGLGKVVNDLGAFGAQLQQRLAGQLDQNAVSTALRNAIGDYTALRSKWLAALNDAANARIALTLGANRSQGETDEALLDILFEDGCGKEAEALYAAVIRGHIDELPRYVRAAGTQIQAAGSLSFKLDRAASTSMTLQALGKVVSWAGSTAASLDVSTTLAGDVTALSGVADAAQATRAWFGNFASSLACVYAASAQDGQGLAGSISFRGSYCYTGDKRTWKDFDDVVTSMRLLCDLPSSADLAARLLPNGAAASHISNAPLNLDIVLPIDLTGAEMKSFATSRKGMAAFAEIAMGVVDATFPNILRGSATIAGQVHGQAGGDLAGFLTKLLGIDDPRQALPIVFGDDVPQSISPADPLCVAAKYVVEIAKLSHAIEQLKSSIATMLALSPAALGTSPADRQAAIVQLSFMSHELAGAATYGTGAEDLRHMPWGLTAFARIVADSVGRPDKGAFIPIAKITEGSQATTLVLAAM